MHQHTITFPVQADSSDDDIVALQLASEAMAQAKERST
jgi:hypothetical protein